MWMDHSFVEQAKPAVSRTPLLRLTVLDSLPPFPLQEPFVAPLPDPLDMASQIAIAMEYVSSPVPQPALQMRSVQAPSSALRP
jgi:hypothetical protein